MSDKYNTFASVYFENSLEAANTRLEWLRKTDTKYPEVKAYIMRVKNQFRVLRRVRIVNSSQKQ